MLLQKIPFFNIKYMIIHPSGYITLFRSITVVCGTNSRLQNIPQNTVKPTDTVMDLNNVTQVLKKDVAVQVICANQSCSLHTYRMPIM